jgi:tripeptide aminopeptidase
MKPASILIQKIDTYRDDWLAKIIKTREMILSNLAMISQVPADTFAEGNRKTFLLDRYIACGQSEPSTDDMDNVISTLSGKRKEKNILIFTHIDHQPEMNIDHNVTITDEKVIGRGVPEDTLALATLISMPDIIKRLELDLNNNIILLASTRSHGRGDLGGLRYFMRKHKRAIDYAINLVGIPLGTVNYFSLSRVRCDITCHIDTEASSPWSKITNISAIQVINEIMNRLYSIPIPRQPKTVLNIGIISGGDRYSTISTNALLKLEVLSEDDNIMEHIIEEINDRCIDIGAKYDVPVQAEFFSRQKAAGLSYSHPLIKSAVEIINFLGYRPIMAFNSTELAIPLSFSIPSVCLGLSTGMMSSTSKGYIDIGPIPYGILQLIMLLYAIDRGHCHG